LWPRDFVRVLAEINGCPTASHQDKPMEAAWFAIAFGMLAFRAVLDGFEFGGGSIHWGRLAAAAEPGPRARRRGTIS
jgi:hypothetical protein